VLNALLTGIGSATRNYRMVVLLWVFNLLFALPITVPVFVLIQQSTSGRLSARRMGGDQLDALWLIDLVNGQFEGASLTGISLTTFFLLLFCGVLYLLANLFFAGGILEVLNRPGFTMRRFWRGGGTYFGRFVRLWFYSLFFYGAVLIGYQIVLQSINKAEKQASAEGPTQVRKIILLLITLLLLALVNLAFDYARISTVWRASRKMWRETVNGWRFALAYLWRTYSLYLLLSLVGLALFAFFGWLRSSVQQTSFLAVVAAFVFGQCAILARAWTRVALYGGQTQLYYQLAPPPPGVKSAPPFEFMPATGELPPLASIAPGLEAAGHNSAETSLPALGDPVVETAPEPVAEKSEERHES
jgi:hypothetical protein